MGLVAAKCTQCGANIEVDASKEAGICAHCGTAFITEKVINNYIIHNHNTVNNNIAHATINIKQDDAEDYANRYLAVIKQKKYGAAFKMLDKLEEKFPDSGITYLCQADYLMAEEYYREWLELVNQGAKDRYYDDGEPFLNAGDHFGDFSDIYDLKELRAAYDAFDSVSDDELREAFRKRNDSCGEIDEKEFLRIIAEPVLKDYRSPNFCRYWGIDEIADEFLYRKRDNFEYAGFDSLLSAVKNSLDTAEALLSNGEREKYADFISGIKEKYAEFEDVNRRRKKAMKRLALLSDVVYADNRRSGKYRWKSRPNVPSHKEIVKKTVKRVIIFCVSVAVAVGVYLIVKKIL